MIFSKEFIPQIRSHLKEVSIRNNLVKSISVIEFIDREAIVRRMALVEDPKGNRVAVLFYKQKFIPPKDKNQSAESPFHSKTVLGEIVVMASGLESFEEADEVAFDRTNSLSIASGMVGIDEDRNLHMSGMSAVVIADSENPNSINEASLQRAIGFLFSSQGPFGEAVIFPDFKDKKLMANLHKGGAEFVIDQYSYRQMLSVAEKFNLKKRFGKYQEQILKAMSVYLRIIKEIYNRGDFLESRGGKGYKEFLMENIEQHMLSQLNN